MTKKYWRVYADEQGESHVEELEMDLALVEFAPPAPPLWVSKPAAAAAFAYLIMPAGWQGDWHPSPRRQIQVLIRGTPELETSDGTRISGEVGTMVLVEDTNGRGHRSWTTGDQDVEILALNLP